MLKTQNHLHFFFAILAGCKYGLSIVSASICESALSSPSLNSDAAGGREDAEVGVSVMSSMSMSVGRTAGRYGRGDGAHAITEERKKM